MAYTDITKSTVTYKVSDGDTFSHIAQRCIVVGMSGYSGLSLYDDGINKLKSFNPDVENVNLIYVGQTLTLQGTAKTKTTTKAQRPKITAFGRQSNTDVNNPIIYATWSWDRSNTKEYKVIWKYGTGDGVGWVLKEETTTYKYSTCENAPENATHVTFQVKPISKTYKKNDKETHYWTADWSTKQTHWFKNDPPSVPPVPTNFSVVDATKTKAPSVTIKLEGLTKDITISNLYLNATHIQFQLLRNGKTTYKNGRVPIFESKDGTATYSCNLTAGDEFKVRCRAFRGKSLGSGKWSETQGVYSDWSDWSSSFGTAPAAHRGFDELFVQDKKTSGAYEIFASWIRDDGDTKEYAIGYTTDVKYFSTTSDTNITIQEVGKDDHAYIEINNADLIGKDLYFALRVKDTLLSSNSSPWSETKHLIIGEAPGQPTTWSLSSTAMIGEQVILYWMHQTVDGSPESFARVDLRIIVGNEEIPVTLNESGEYIERVGDNYITVENTQVDKWGNPIATTSSYSMTIPDNNLFKEGVIIKWRIQTSGIYTENDSLVYGEWSDYRQIDVYAKPTVDLTATIPNDIEIGVREEDGVVTETPVTHFPITVTATTNAGGSTNQKVIGYYVFVTADSEHETVDYMGNVKMVSAGEVIYSQHFDVDTPSTAVELSAGNIDLSNGQSYTLTCEVAMDSGLMAKNTLAFSVEWDEEELWPNLEITYDPDNYSTILCPYCDDGNSTPLLLSGILLSVYRREFDGTLTELATGLNNEDEVYITDPHPSLDYARYRVVAMSEDTGAVSYYDVPAFPISEKAMILQWDEEWREFDVNEEFEPEGNPWVGSLLRLPYNIDVSDSHDPEVELVKYIGRENPVGYYGTHIGHTSIWNTEIPKSDTETLYAIRRLSRWRGNVYVREPSGSGYLANIKVSYSQKHKELTIPITLTVTRVED